MKAGDQVQEAVNASFFVKPRMLQEFSGGRAFRRVELERLAEEVLSLG